MRFGLLFLCACTASPTMIAKLTEVSGEAFVNGEQLNAGDVLRDGDLIEVRQGRVELDIDGVGKLRVFSSTQLRLQPRQGTLWSVQLLTGRLWSIVEGLNGAGYEVHTPTAVAGVRGTEFVVEASDEETDIAVASGEVEARHGDETRRVRAGEKRKFRKRSPPGEAERYDHSRDRVRWDELRQAFRDVGKGIKKGGRSFGRKVRDIFR